MTSIDVFTAIAHPTRREIMAMLADGRPMSLSNLADRFTESRQAIRKHVRLLDESALIRIERCGREQHCTLQPERLAEVQNWLSFFNKHWDQKLSALDHFLGSPQSKAIEVKATTKRTSRQPRKKSSNAGKRSD